MIKLEMMASVTNDMESEIVKRRIEEIIGLYDGTCVGRKIRNQLCECKAKENLFKLYKSLIEIGLIDETI